MSRQTPTENRYCVCIGINGYQPSAGLSSLAYAEADAQAMDAQLGELGFEPENRCLLLGREATLQAVNDALSALILDRPKENDLVVFYFAGHSLPVVINQSEVEEGAEQRSEVFLASYDFDRQRIKEFPSFRRQHGLGMERLRTMFFEGEGSRKRLFLFDSCYSGDFYGPHYRDEEVDPVQSYIKHALGTNTYGRVALSSCLPIQRAVEDAALGHGRFTYSVLEALSGRAVEALNRDGWLTVNGLFEYLTRNLPPDQRPVLSGVQQDSFRLVYYPDKVVLRNASLLQIEKPEHAEKEARLRALLADHTGFMRDRLASFVGREKELAKIRQRIGEYMLSGGYVTITGHAGQGKSSIIAKLVEEYGPERVVCHFIPFNPGPDHQVGLLRNLMAHLILKYDLSDLYVTSESRPALRDYFLHVLKDVAAKGGKVIIFIDGLDQLEEDATGVRDLTFLPSQPPPGIVFVLGTRPNDTLKPLELLKPHDEYQLPNLSREDFDHILQHRRVSLDRTLADRFYQSMQENALYLDLVAQELAKPGGVGPEEIIERVATNPQNLFSLSIARLKRQVLEWREVLKPILGILLVAREPLSLSYIRHILLLDSDQLRDGIDRLGGLVSNNGLGRYALFHLKFYDYLLQDEHNPNKNYVFARDEEEGWHKRLAEWCEQVNIQVIWEDAPHQTLEQERRVYARKHYITHLYFSRDCRRLFAVLDAHSYGRMKVRYDPSTRLYSEDLDLGREAAGGKKWIFDEAVGLLPHLWRYTLLRCSLASRADRYPEAAFQLLMLLGREQEALGLAELLTSKTLKAQVFIQMVLEREERQKREGNQRREANFIDLLMRAFDVVCTLEYSGTRTEALRELGAVLIRAQQWVLAERVIDAISDSSRRAETLRELGTALMQAQQDEQAKAIWTEAERVIDAISDSSRRAETLCALGVALAQAQHSEQAKAVLAKAEQAIDAIAESYWRAEPLKGLGTALIQAGQWAEAERVIGMIEDKDQRIAALCELGVALVRAQQSEQAKVVWAKAKQKIDAIADSSRLTTVLQELSTALARAQQWTEAERVIDAIADSGLRASVLQMLGTALARTQQWAEAERIIDAITDSSRRVGTLCRLGVALAQAQHSEQAKAVLAKARRVIGKIDHSGWQPAALCELGVALAQAQHSEQAKAVLAEARRVIDAIADGNRRAEALRELGVALAQAQHSEQAKAMLAEARQLISMIKFSEWRAEPLCKLGVALMQAQHSEQAKVVLAEARQLISMIENSEWHVEALCELGVALMQTQQNEQAKAVWTEAGQIIGKIADRDRRADALHELSATLNAANEQIQLLHLIQHSWQQADTRDYAIALLPLANGLIPLKPKIGLAFYETFSWVNEFLRG